MSSRRKILLIDDNEALRVLLGHLLLREGHDVVQLATPDTAIEAIARRGGSTDLIITDLTMYNEGPHGGVPPLASLAPGVPVIFISGYPRTHAVRRFGLSPDAIFLQKPFPLPLLLQEIEAVFGTHPPRATEYASRRYRSALASAAHRADPAGHVLE